MRPSLQISLIIGVLIISLASLAFAFPFKSSILSDILTKQQNVSRAFDEDNYVDEEYGACFKVQCDLTPSNNTCSFFSDSDTIYHQCKGTHFCNSTNDCELKFPDGHECQSSAECEQHNAYVFPQCKYNVTMGISVCVTQIGGWPGDDCITDEDCRSGQCNGTSWLCEGLSQGDECTGIGQCDRGFYCNQSTNCLPQHEINETCDSTSECAPEWTGRVCIRNNCSAPFSLGKGFQCDTQFVMEPQCGGGLYCDPYSETCQTHQFIECNIGNDTMCASLPQTTCMCDHTTGSGMCSVPGLVSHTPEAISYYQDFVSCAIEHSCRINPTSSCFNEHCSEYFDCYTSEWIKSSGYDPECFGFEVKCNLNSQSSSQQNTQSSAAPSGWPSGLDPLIFVLIGIGTSMLGLLFIVFIVVAILVMIVIVVIVLYWRKQEKPDSQTEIIIAPPVELKNVELKNVEPPPQNVHIEYSALDIPFKDLVISEKLGRGAFGDVFKATYQGSVFALKVLEIDSEGMAGFLAEAKIMAQLQHPRLLQFVGVVNDDGKFGIVMEFMDRGSLDKLLWKKKVIKLSWQEKMGILNDVASGMAFIHSRGFIHRDLKSPNILIGEANRAKIGDFGLARVVDKATSTMTSAGSPLWMAPEVVESSGHYDNKCDVFSFGIIMWELMNEKEPYHDVPNKHSITLNVVRDPKFRPTIPSVDTVMELHSTDEERKSIDSTFTSCITLMRECWTQDPSARPTFQQVIHFLNVMTNSGEL